MASEEVRGSFCRYDSCVITDQLATDAGALERELLTNHQPQIPLATIIPAAQPVGAADHFAYRQRRRIAGLLQSAKPDGVVCFSLGS